VRTSLRRALWLVAAVLGALALPDPCRAQTAPAVTVPTAGGDVSVTADRIEEIGPERLLLATGNVEIVRGQTRLLADRVEINRETGDAVAQGRVVFYDADNQLTGRRIDYNLRTGTGVVHEAEGRVSPYYRLGGERMDRLGESLYRVHRGVFTTCEDDPPTWSFRFGSATADLEDFVYGTGASFWVKNIPLIPFVPFFAAAIRRERQTGFLFPKVGTSGSKGFQLEAPFFWAISDSADATIAPIVYSERGVGLSVDHRHVLSLDQRGGATGFLLQETERNGATRGMGSLRHDWETGPRLSLKVDVNAVTGDTVLEEYGDRLQQRSSQRVESNIFLTRSWESWNAVGNLFAYQDLTRPRPVELNRLPDLSVLGVSQPIPGLPGFLYELEAGYVNFARVVGSNGQRLDLHPRVSRPLSLGGLLTLTPFAGGRLTAYDKTVVGTRISRGAGRIEVTEDDARLRRLLEAGADLETQLVRVYPAVDTWGIEALLHTIEPRVTALWITGKNQDKLPIWTEGVDRIPDTTQIQYSITNRLRARTAGGPEGEPVRWEALRVAVGQSYDLRKEQAGDVFGTLIVQPTDRVRFRGDLVHGVRGEGVQIATGDVQVRVDPVSLSVGSRYSDPARVNFLTTGLIADLTRHVTVRNTNHFDIRSRTFVESRVSMDVRFQCWALTVEYVHRERRDDELRFAVNLLGVGGPIRTSIGLGALDGLGER
jgi:LPS-assembly protein